VIAPDKRAHRNAPVWKRGVSPPALIPYLVAGDPDLESTRHYLKIAASRGVFAVELGVPFSDPTADGPVIQAAAQRSLRHETAISSLLDWIGSIPREDLPPIYLMTYFNLFHHMGLRAFCEKARATGRIAGVVIPDLSFEDARDYRPVFREFGINLVGFVSPTTDPDRARRIVRESRGFVYYVGLMGTTGAALSITDSARKMVGQLREWTALPVCMGFGVSSGETAQEVLGFADGVIVGSRLVKDERQTDLWEKTFLEFVAARDRAGRLS
jgi:tryptophan synthase alpha chain